MKIFDNLILRFFYMLLSSLYVTSDEKFTIIQGRKAKIGYFPSMISIQTVKGHHFCAGTLVSLDTIISAAHCFDEIDKSKPWWKALKLVGNDIEVPESPHSKRQTRYVLTVAIHNHYNKVNVHNDIAALKTYRNFDARLPSFHPIRWATKKTPLRTPCNISGWGDTSLDRNKPQMSPHLLYASVHITAESDCQQIKYLPFNGLLQICAGAFDSKEDACTGDSGGALICNNMLTGIVSYGIGCGLPNYPGVYTNVSSFDDWIISAIIWDRNITLGNIYRFNNNPSAQPRRTYSRPILLIFPYCLVWIFNENF